MAGLKAGKIPVLLLAGGRSTRMPCAKGLYRPAPGGPTWLEIQLESLSRVGAEARVVLGYRSEEYFQALPWLAERNPIVNPLPEFGPFSSIQAGAREIELSRGAFVLPIDVPCPDVAAWNALLEASARYPGLEAAIPIHQGRGGHPVWLSRRSLERLLALDPSHPDSRLDFFLRSLATDAIARVGVSDPRCLLNLNTPEDFFRAEISSWTAEKQH